MDFLTGEEKTYVKALHKKESNGKVQDLVRDKFSLIGGPGYP